MRIRSHATWSVPEPELTLFINPTGTIVGYTIGKHIRFPGHRGREPSYLPEAKVYDGSCAIGPCILIWAILSEETDIQINIIRGGRTEFSGSTEILWNLTLSVDLVKYLFRENSFPQGAFLMTGKPELFQEMTLPGERRYYSYCDFRDRPSRTTVA